MGRKCCVPDCNSNYDATLRKGQSAISTFKFPEDVDLRNRWIRAVNRSTTWQPGRTACICIDHFQPEDIVKYDKPAKLRSEAVPTIFGHVLKNVGEPVIKLGRPKKITGIGQDCIGPIVLDGKQDELEVLQGEHVKPADAMIQELILDFESFNQRVVEKDRYGCWHYYRKDNVLHFYNIDDEDGNSPIRIDNSIKIFEDMRMSLFLRELKIEDDALVWILGNEAKLCRWSQFDTILKKYDFKSLRMKESKINLKAEYCINTDKVNNDLEQTDNRTNGSIEDNFIEQENKTFNTTLKLEIEEISNQEDEIEFLDYENDASDTESVQHLSRNPLQVCKERSVTQQESVERKNVRETVRSLKNFKNKCYICDQEHASGEAFEHHLPDHITMLPYRCEQCVSQEVTIKTLASLNKHFLMHLKPLKCRTCDVRFSSYGTRLLHEQNSHMNSRSLACEVCGKVLRSQRGYQHHFKIHTNPEAMKCQLCGKQLSSSYELKLHMRVHTKEKPNKCPFCAASFNRVSNLVEHKRRFHCKERPFACLICEDRFRSNVELKRHEVISHGSVAPKKPTKERLVRRPNTASTINLKRDFHCKTCDKRLPSASSYHSHMRKHQKRYQCSYCGLRVGQLRDFIDHENTHTGKRPYECEICSKKFKTSSTYYGHRAVHSTEKRFSCETCGRRFSRLRYMLLHAKIHAAAKEVKSYSCSECGKIYTDRNSFKKHLESHRKVEENPILEEKPVTQMTSVNGLEQQRPTATITMQMPQDVTRITEVPQAVSVALSRPMVEQMQLPRLPQILQTVDGREAILLTAEMIAPQNIIFLQQSMN